MVSKETVQKTVQQYGEAWVEQDKEKVLSLFTKDGTYHEYVLDKPYRGHAEIGTYWQRKVIEEQTDISFKHLSTYIDGDTAIVEWEATFSNNWERKKIRLQEVAIIVFDGEKIQSLREYWHAERLLDVKVQRNSKRILIIGTWRENEVDELQEEAAEIGRLLAEKGCSLISGGGKGASAAVVDAYKKHNGKEFIVMLPGQQFMAVVGEEPGPKADITIFSHKDYPQRNIRLVSEVDGVIGLSGGLSTLVEVITAAKDYKRKVAVIDKGELARHIHALPELKQKILLTKDARKAVEYVTR